MLGQTCRGLRDAGRESAKASLAAQAGRHAGVAQARPRCLVDLLEYELTELLHTSRHCLPTILVAPKPYPGVSTALGLKFCEARAQRARHTCCYQVLTT